jgi:hypothetical protein
MSIVLYQYVSLLPSSHCQVMEKHVTLRYLLFYWTCKSLSSGSEEQK